MEGGYISAQQARYDNQALGAMAGQQAQQSPLAMQIDELERGLRFFDDQLSQLVQKVEPIMSPQPPEAQVNKIATMPHGGSALVLRLISANEQLRHMVGALRTIRERIEA